MSEKVRENRLRRMAERQGYVLEKSRRRDKRARGYGKYRLIANGGERLGPDWDGPDYRHSLDDVESFLLGPEE